jgi:hypothetical protein
MTCRARCIKRREPKTRHGSDPFGPKAAKGLETVGRGPCFRFWIAERRHEPEPTNPHRHTPIEDLHALLIGSSFIAVGLTLLKAAGLVTGGVAGVALIVSYLTNWPVGTVFLVLNIPFYILAQRTLGWAFTFKTLATNLLLAGPGVGHAALAEGDRRRSDLRGGVRRHDHRHGHPGPGAAPLQRRRRRGAGALSAGEARDQRRQGADGRRLPGRGGGLHSSSASTSCLLSIARPSR